MLMDSCDPFEDSSDCDGGYHSDPKPVVCNKCGKKNLRWRQHASGKYWMKELSGEWHKCSPEVLQAREKREKSKQRLLDRIRRHQEMIVKLKEQLIAKYPNSNEAKRFSDELDPMCWD